MLERGLKPFQTLYHRDIPSALADIGGWTNRATARAMHHVLLAHGAAIERLRGMGQ